MKHTKEYQEFVKVFGQYSDLIIAKTMQQQKGKLNETKKGKILRTLRTGKDVGGSDGIGKPFGKTVSPIVLPSGQNR
jgi:hypothetical protein